MTLMTASAAESCCPGCDETDGVEQTTSTPSVAAWECTCGLSWTTTVVNPQLRPAYLAIGGAAEEIGRLRWKLAQVTALADDAVGLTGEQLRDRLLALAR
jgi:hypothetical protein